MEGEGKIEISRKRSAAVDSDAEEQQRSSRRRKIDVEVSAPAPQAPEEPQAPPEEPQAPPEDPELEAPPQKLIREDTIILDPKPQFIRQDTFTIDEPSDEKCPTPSPSPLPAPSPHPSTASSTKHTTASSVSAVVRGECCKYQIQEVRHLRRLLSDGAAATAAQVRRERQEGRRQRDALEAQLRAEAAADAAERDRRWRRELQQARRRTAELEAQLGAQLKEAKRLHKVAATPPVLGLRVGKNGPSPGPERKKPPTRPSTAPAPEPVTVSPSTANLSTQTDLSHDDSSTQTEGANAVADGEVQCSAAGCLWVNEGLLQGLNDRIAVLKEALWFGRGRRWRVRQRERYPPFAPLVRPAVKRLDRPSKLQLQLRRPKQRDSQEGKYQLHTNEYEHRNPPMRHFNKLEPVVESTEDADGDALPSADADVSPSGCGTPTGTPTPAMVGSASPSPSHSPPSSGPSSLSPTPCIAELWNNLSGACTDVRGSSKTKADHPSVHFWHTDPHLESQRLKLDNAQAKICELRQELQSALKCRDAAVLAAACAAQNLDRAMAELADLREQNELLEFRLLELEGDKIEELRPEVAEKSTTTGAELACLETLSDAVQQLRHLSERLKGGDGACAARAASLLDEHVLTRGKRAPSSSAPSSPALASNRIVATVLPFSAPQSAPGDQGADTLSAAAAEEARLKSLEEFRKKKEFFSRKCNAASDKGPVRLVHRTHSLDGYSDDASPLQESGIFEADDDEGPEDGHMRLSRAASAAATIAVEVATQTDASATNAPPAADTAAAAGNAAGKAAGNDDLQTEIQKLSQIRKRFQEQPPRLKAAKTQASSNDAVVATPQIRELEFLRQRAAELESRLAQIQLAGGDAVRGAARLLEREAVLQHQLKQAHDAAEQLRARARNLEEEKCELEEVENDTRLRCQRLEVEVVGLRERESALECELECARRLPAEAAETAIALQELRSRHALLQRAVPALVVFALLEAATIWHRRMANAKRYLPAPATPSVKTLQQPNADKLLERLEVLSAAERDLKLKVDFLEKKEAAFQETLAAADGLWADMEADYKRRLATAEEAAAALQERLRHLEASDVHMRAATRREQRALERVADLEAAEATFRGRLATAEAAAREAAAAAEAAAAREAAVASSKIRAADRALQDMEVTCAELREEVDTLEEAVSTLKMRLAAANEAVEQTACDAERRLAAKERQIDELRRRFRERSQPSVAALVDEMALAEASASASATNCTSPPTSLSLPPPPPPPRRPTVGLKPAAPPRPPTLMVMPSRWNGNTSASQRSAPPPQAAR